MSYIGMRPRTMYAASEGQLFATDTTLVVVTCATCGVTYAIPESFDRSAQKYHGDFPNGWSIVCPFGHSWHYVGESDIEKANRLLEKARKRERATRDLLDHEQRSHAATRGHLTRQKKRVAAGVCPCCNRTFKQLAAHMANKHPEFSAERGDDTNERPALTKNQTVCNITGCGHVANRFGRYAGLCIVHRTRYGS